MKKFKCFLLIFVLLLTSCSDRNVYFNYGEMTEKVIKIEIVGMESTSLDKSNVLQILDDELIDDFLYDLSNIEFIRPLTISNIQRPSGISFCIYYTNNDYDIVNYFATSIGTLPDASCSIEDYNYLVNKYYTHQ